ncbi:hypothetical protein EVAR_35565_1 [Eumeta japonica]|uniref:Uncharacterized protein n=1 Tax=Eumeta variegata TaxID=151549 RepID=A0A4C1XJS1_EUMVA|nr:hypothetical protein EVAR_35565_1 [Eumeta japonica]
MKLVTKASQWRKMRRGRRRKGREAFNLRDASFVGNSERQSFVRCTVNRMHMAEETQSVNILGRYRLKQRSQVPADSHLTRLRFRNQAIWTMKDFKNPVTFECHTLAYARGLARVAIK